MTCGVWVAARQCVRCRSVRAHSRCVCQCLRGSHLLPLSSSLPQLSLWGYTHSWLPFGPRPTEDAVSSFISPYFL